MYVCVLEMSNRCAPQFNVDAVIVEKFDESFSKLNATVQNSIIIVSFSGTSKNPMLSNQTD